MAQAKPIQQTSGVAEVYAEALLPLVRQSGDPAGTLEALDQVQCLVAREPVFAEMLATPLVSDDRRVEIIEQTFRGKVSDLVCDALEVIARHGRMGLFAAILKALHRRWLTEEGFIEVEVTSATPLTNDHRQGVEAALARRLKAKPLVTYQVDPAILGGLLVRVGDEVLDSSVRNQLEQMKTTLSRGPRDSRAAG